MRRRLRGGRGRFEQIAKSGPSAKEAGTDGVERKAKQVGDFSVTELLEFAKEENFAVEGVELFDGAADPKAGFGRVRLRWFQNTLAAPAKKQSAEICFAAMGAEDFESDGVEISAEKRASFVTGGGAKDGNPGFLRKLFSVGGIGDAAAEEAVNRLLVTAEEFGKSFGRAECEIEHEALVVG